MSKRAGIDIGGVVIDAIGNDGTDTDLRGDRYMETTPVAGVFDAVKRLVEEYGVDNVFIVSKCKAVIEGKTREWLAGNNFYSFTGFNPSNLYFCETREGKAPIVEDLGITDFVDDRADVLRHMEGIVARRYLFGPQSDTDQNVDGLIVVNDWNEALPLLLSEV